MATTEQVYCSYGEHDEITFMNRNDMKLAVVEGDGRLRLYEYGRVDPFRERVGRFLHDGITQLWDNQELLDLEVRVGEKVFRCHRAILASVSGLFKDELTSEQMRSGWQLSQCVTVTLDDGYITPEIFELVLELIYKGTDIVHGDLAQDLMRAAYYLKIKSLESRCLDVLIKELGQKSCMKTWDWAEANNFPYLASKAKGIALSNFQVLRHTVEFLQIPVERLTMMLGHELLKYRCEDDILEAVLDWVEFDRNDRKQHLPELLRFVIFPYLSTHYLNDLRKNELIGLQTEFASYVDEALTYHLAALQKDGRKIQREVLKRQVQSLNRFVPGMRRVVVLIGGAVVQEEPLTNVVACYLDMGHPQSRFREVLQFSIASLPQPIGLRFASSEWKHDIFVSGGSRSSDTLLVYSPNMNTWHRLKPLPRARENHAMVSVDGKLYLLGGRAYLKDCYDIIPDISEYNIESETWRQTGELAVAVEAAAAVAISHKIYIFGGQTASGDKVSVIQCLDTHTSQISIIGHLPQVTEGAKAIVLGKDIILICPDGNIYKIQEDLKRSCEVMSTSIKEEQSHDVLQSTAAVTDEIHEDLKREHQIMLESSFEKEPSHEHLQSTPAVTDEVASPFEADAFISSKAVHDKDHMSRDESEGNQDKAQDDNAVNKKCMEQADFSSTKINLGITGEQNSCEPRGLNEEAEHTVDDSTDPTAHFERKHGGSPLEQVCDEENSGCMESKERKEFDEENLESEDTTKLEKELKKESAYQVIITKIASMEKRSDFGLFIRKADVMVVGGQSENGYFLDDMLRIHVPTGQVCKTNGKLIIPVSGMQVECTAIHESFLLQFFDAASCFYGD